MSKIPGYEGPAHSLSSPIEALTAVNTAEYNHRAVGIRSCENAFHLASTILGGRNIVEEFIAAEFGRSLMAGPQMRSCTSMLTGQHKKFLFRSSALN
jgi:hypothetical protein